MVCYSYRDASQDLCIGSCLYPCVLHYGSDFHSIPTEESQIQYLENYAFNPFLPIPQVYIFDPCSLYATLGRKSLILNIDCHLQFFGVMSGYSLKNR